GIAEIAATQRFLGIAHRALALAQRLRHVPAAIGEALHEVAELTPEIALLAAHLARAGLALLTRLSLPWITLAGLRPLAALTLLALLLATLLALGLAELAILLARHAIELVEVVAPLLALALLALTLLALTALLTLVGQHRLHVFHLAQHLFEHAL